MEEAPATPPPEGMQTATFDVTRVTEAYVDLRTGETRLAVMGVYRTETGFDSMVQVFRLTEGGGELIRNLQLPSRDLGAAYLDLGSLRQRLGVPDSVKTEIMEPTDRATMVPDRVPGRQEPTSRERATSEGPPEAPEELEGPPEEPTPEERAGMGGADVPVGEDPADRAEAEEPGGFETPLSEAADVWDEQVEQADRASAVLRGQLEGWVDEGGSWVVGALGATALDVAGAAMHFTQGLADTARFGQGLSKGSWEGVREDAGRLLNVLPAGRVAKVLGVGLGVADAVAAGQQGSGMGVAAGIAAAGAAALVKKGGKGKKGVKGKQNAKNTKPKPKPPPKPAKPKQPFTSYKDLPPMKGQHRHHIALAGIFRRARSKALRDLELEIGSEYLLDKAIKKGGTHHILHRIVNIQLKIAELFPGSAHKRTFTNREVEKALRVLADTYRTEKIDDFADYIDELIDTLKRQGKL
jgi:hypothetical protein